MHHARSRSRQPNRNSTIEVWDNARWSIDDAVIAKRTILANKSTLILIFFILTILQLKQNNSKTMKF